MRNFLAHYFVARHVLQRFAIYLCAEADLQRGAEMMEKITSSFICLSYAIKKVGT